MADKSVAYVDIAAAHGLDFRPLKDDTGLDLVLNVKFPVCFLVFNLWCRHNYLIVPRTLKK